MNCQSCNRKIPGWARDTCPYCRMPISQKKVSYVMFLPVGVIGMLIIILLMSLPPPPDTPPPQPCLNCTPTPTSGPIAITGVRQGTTILVTVRGDAGVTDASNYTVQLNGVSQPEKLAANAGTSILVDRASSPNSDHLIVIANYRNGTQRVVFDNHV